MRKNQRSKIKRPIQKQTRENQTQLSQKDSLLPLNVITKVIIKHYLSLKSFWLITSLTATSSPVWTFTPATRIKPEDSTNEINQKDCAFSYQDRALQRIHCQFFCQVWISHQLQDPSFLSNKAKQKVSDFFSKIQTTLWDRHITAFLFVYAINDDKPMWVSKSRIESTVKTMIHEFFYKKIIKGPRTLLSDCINVTQIG